MISEGYKTVKLITCNRKNLVINGLISSIKIRNHLSVVNDLHRIEQFHKMFKP